jgi:hypothetical protein
VVITDINVTISRLSEISSAIVEWSSPVRDGERYPAAAAIIQHSERKYVLSLTSTRSPRSSSWCSIEFGAAWKKTARDSDREYLSVKLDDPSFPAPFYASLVKVEGSDSFTLIWSRGGGDWPTPDHRPCLFGGRAFFALRSLPPRKRNSIFF